MEYKEPTPPDNGCDDCHFTTIANGVRCYCPECELEQEELWAAST
jgi:Zn finger protein HypA/HybF involved in hydrogenase expression